MISSKITLRKISVAVILVFAVFTANAQLTTNSASMTSTQLVQNILVGSGVSVSGVHFYGDSTQRGSFGGTSNIGFTTGMMLSSGDIANAIGPNIGTGTTSSFSTTSTDPDLTAIATGTVNDASILEFDFIPISDSIKFRYVFASEEYPEYVCSTFDDVFGFFLSGPNPAGGSYTSQNIAIIPGSGGLAVAINTVNPGIAGASSGGGSCTSLAYSGFYNDNTGGASVEYDGFTVPLTAAAAVVCGQSYHIKLAIADVSDWAFDSGVFLEAGSFTSPVVNIALTSTSIVAGVPGTYDTLLYEGCSNVTLHFQRSGTPCMMSFPGTAYYTISGTATNGVDYSFIGDSIYFPANVDTASVWINALADLITEGAETITITMNSTTLPTSITITILDAPPMTVALNNDTTFTCPPGPILLTANALGGVTASPYTYTWVNATGTGNTASVSPITTTTCYVIASDACGNTATDSMTITISSYIPMQMTITSDTNICPGDVVNLQAIVSNGSPAYTYVWNPGSSTSNTMSVSPATSTTYSVTVTDNCNQTISNHVTVTPHNLEAGFSELNLTNQNLQFNNESFGALSYLWNFGDGSVDATSTVTDPQHYYENNGTYTVTLVITNSLGCMDTSKLTLLVLPDFYFYFPNCFSPNGDGNNDLFSGYGYGIESYRMLIFDRFGEKIYETSDINNGWNGSYMGKQVQEGLYVVEFNLTTFMNKEINKTGHVSLIR